MVQKSVEAGVKRQSADIAASAVFKGNTADAKATAAAFGQQIGMSYTETLKGMTDFGAGAAPSLGYQGSKDFYEQANIFGRLRGLDNEKMKGMMLAFTQMASKGTLSADEVKNQLPEHVPGGEQLIADAIGVSVPELNKIMSTGKLMSKDVLPKLSDHLAKLNEEAGGLAKVSGMAVTGIGRVKAGLENNLVKGFDAAEGGMGKFNSSLAKLLADSVPISEALGHIFGEIASVAASAVDDIDYMARMASVAFLRMSAWYMDLDDGQKKLVDGAQRFGTELVAVVATVGTLATVAGKLKWLANIAGAASTAGTVAGEAGTAAAGAAAKGAGKGLLARAGGAFMVVGAAELAQWLMSPETLYNVMGAKDTDTPSDSPFTRLMEPLTEWLRSNNAMNPSNGTMGADNLTYFNTPIPSSFNPSMAIPAPDVKATLNLNVMLDGNQIGHITDKSISLHGEDVNVATEHLGD
ncbi:hypothetical protein AU509_02995 [Lonsdalea britannica]|uniref:tape measure protein n=1 Tax=Lonsdalea britannica TaxID=1082704 RepID=UPI000A2425AB|nr:tape measure protein [Lonsdalea britannica]OSM99791.1 hypothetical protein AU509_02995 [Lonsdalea britannica]